MATGNSNLALSGLVSGMDWQSLIDQLANAERSTQTRLRMRQSLLSQKHSAFGNIKNQLSLLQTQIIALKDPKLYESRSAQVSNSSIATVTANAGAALGAFNFSITQLATAARLNGTANIGKPLSADGNLDAVTIGTAGFATPVKAGTFTVNGKQITIAATDSLQQVFDKIATATGNVVTASYNVGTDRITLASNDSSEIILGSATDSSNFLQVSRLNNNGSDAITSSGSLGGVRLAGPLADADLVTPINDGGAGAGEFRINGVSITYNAVTDNLNSILNRINNSAAGVAASYDTVNDRFVLANKATGDIGVALEDVTGNFLAATGLTGGAIVRGKDLVYTVNNGDPLTSHSNTITEESSGIAGLSVTAIATGAVTVTVNSDTAKIKSAIQSFISAYNNVQSYIGKQVASTTDSKGDVTTGVLTADRDAIEIVSSLRKLSFAPLSGLAEEMNHLADLGIQSNGNDNTLVLKDSTALDNALAGNLTRVQSFFADPTNGFTLGLDQYLTKTIGDGGTLISHQDALNKQSSDIDAQIVRMEKLIEAQSARLRQQFIAMEKAQAQMNNQLQFLMSRFPTQS